MVRVKERRIKMWVTPEFRQHVYKLKAEKHPNKPLLDILDIEFVKKEPKKKKEINFWGKI